MNVAAARPGTAGAVLRLRRAAGFRRAGGFYTAAGFRCTAGLMRRRARSRSVCAGFPVSFTDRPRAEAVPALMNAALSRCTALSGAAVSAAFQSHVIFPPCLKACLRPGAAPVIISQYTTIGLVYHFSAVLGKENKGKVSQIAADKLTKEALTNSALP